MQDHNCFSVWVTFIWVFPCGSSGKESACNVGDLGSIPGLGRSPGERKGYPLYYSGLENFMDCIVHRIAKSQTRLSNFYFHSFSYLDRVWEHFINFYAYIKRMLEWAGTSSCIGMWILYRWATWEAKKNDRNNWTIAHTHYISNGVSNGFWNNMEICCFLYLASDIKEI